MQKLINRWPCYLCRILVIGAFATVLSSLTFGSSPAGPNSKFHFKNITHSNDYFEINPRFVDNGNQVLFLVFTGDPESPNPWDYVLTKSDREGHTAYYLSTKGVLDYNVLANDTGVLVLKVVASIMAGEFGAEAYEDIKDWELWHLNFRDNQEVLLESSMGLPLSEGYKMLGLADLPKSKSGQIMSASPRKARRLIIQRERKDRLWFFKYFLFDENSNRQEVFETESWRSYSDMDWWPKLCWLDDNSFLTISFTSILDKDFSQSEGVFSIVKVDLTTKTSQILYSDFYLSPFPKFVLNSSATLLYFQKLQDEVTELWRLNLFNRNAEVIYRVKGHLGEVRLSLDESSLVFTQLFENNFDIIRLDMSRERIQQ